MVVGSDAVGLGGPRFVSMSPARIGRAASHALWLADRKNGLVLLLTKGLVGGGLSG